MSATNLKHQKLFVKGIIYIWVHKIFCMKQVTLQVDEKKYRFFMELVKSFDFVTVQPEDVVKKQTLRHIAEGMQMAILAGEGKIKSRSAKAFLNEL